MQKEFDELKIQISGMSGLLLPRYDKEFMLRIDASNTGLGLVLWQQNELRNRQPV